MDVVPVLPHLCNFEAHPHPQYCAARSPIASYVLQSPDRSVKEALYQLQHTLRCVVCKGLLTNPAISYPSSRMFFSCGSSNKNRILTGTDGDIREKVVSHP